MLSAQAPQALLLRTSGRNQRRVDAYRAQARRDAHAWAAAPEAAETARQRIARRLGASPVTRPLTRRVGGIRFLHVGCVTVTLSAPRAKLQALTLGALAHGAGFAIGATIGALI